MAIKDWIYKRFNRYPCTLPDHLRNYKGTNKVKLHNDWPLFLKSIPRSYNTYGPRCPGPSCEICGGAGFKPWPPTLIRGRGVARWEATGENHSILYIPILDSNKEVTGNDVYGTVFRVIEMNPGLDDYGRSYYTQINKGGPWSPSAMQIFSKKGYLQLEPDYHSRWYWFKGVGSEQPWGFFMRSAYRPDHNDQIYNDGPFIGMKPE